MSTYLSERELSSTVLSATPRVRGRAGYQRVPKREARGARANSHSREPEIEEEVVGIFKIGLVEPAWHQTQMQERGKQQGPNAMLAARVRAVER